jgi:hypothetical protein
VLKVAGEKGANIRDVTALVAASCTADCICQKIGKVRLEVTGSWS